MAGVTVPVEEEMAVRMKLEEVEIALQVEMSSKSRGGDDSRG